MLKRLIEVICDGCKASGGVVLATTGQDATNHRRALFKLGWRRYVSKFDVKRGKDWCPECAARKRERHESGYEATW